MTRVSLQWAVKFATAYFGPMVELDDKCDKVRGGKALHLIKKYDGLNRVVGHTYYGDSWYIVLKMAIPRIFSNEKRLSDYFTQGYLDELACKRKHGTAMQANSARGLPKDNDKCTNSDKHI